MLRLVSVLVLLTLSARAWAGDRYALVVGANDGGEARAKLRYAAQDAGNIAEALQSLGQFPSPNTYSLQQPAKADVLNKLKALADAMAKKPEQAEFVFYYSGHADDYGLLLGKERLPYSVLKETVKNLPAKVKLLIIDACSSGSLSAGKGGSPQASILAPLKQEARGFAIMTSSSANESAQESERLRSSFFTHFLLAGMRGAADINQDHLVTLYEVYQYANQKTQEATSKTRMGAQHPTYDFQLKGQSDVVLTDLRQHVSSIEFPADSEGTFYIRSTSGNFFLELQKKPDVPETLAVESGHYEIVQNAGSQYFQGEFALKAKQRISLKAIALKPLPAEKVAIRGDFDFPTFYERSFVHVSLLPSRSMWDGSKKTNQTAVIHLSPFIASIERLDGVGLGFIGHMSREFRGVTGALAFNYNQISASGGQLSLGMNMSEELHGIQFAPLNYSYSLSGAQIGFVNVSSLVSGAQIGLINIAESVDGTQFGLINYAERSEGISFAPITIVKNGIFRAELWTDGTAIPNLGFRSGNPYFYSTFFFGQGHSAMIGMGPGLRLPYQDEALSFDISWAFYRTRTTEFRYTSFFDGNEHVEPAEEQLRNLLRMRLFYEWPFAKRWNGMFGVSRVTQKYSDSEKRRFKHYGSFLPSENGSSERTDVGLMLGLSYSLLEGHI